MGNFRLNRARLIAFARRLEACRRGNFMIIAAFMAAVFVTLFGLVVDAGSGLIYKSQAKRVLSLTCERATKPTRTMLPSDSNRRQVVLNTFDRLATSTNQRVLNRDVTIGWLEATVAAQFSFEPPFRKLFGGSNINYNLSYSCQGIPPYPHDGQIILSSALTKPDGSAPKLEAAITDQTPDGCWNVFAWWDINWDGGTGPGPEVQDWSNENCRSMFLWEGLPPVDFPNRYAIELDSHANSSIWKTVELHPGTYRISMWYNGRNNSLEGSNIIDVYLKRMLPVEESEDLIISMRQNSGEVEWKYYEYLVNVDEYSVYRFTLAAGGPSDSFGGVITALSVQYIDTL